MSDRITERWWWRWMPGMRWVADRGQALDPVAGRVPDDPPRGWAPYPGSRPDLTDPATLGCLTQRARDLNGCPGLGFHRDVVSGLWVPADVLHLPLWLRHIAATSEWSALMAAGDAAWARNPTTSNPTTPKDNTP